MVDAVNPPAPRSPRFSGWFWILPALIVFVLLYTVPLAQMLLRSVMADTVTLDHYGHILAEHIYLKVYWITIQVGIFVTLGCLIAGYPLAYFLTCLQGRWLQFSLIFILLPFWISSLVRNYAWIAILTRNGILNTMLLRAGIISEPLPLMYNMTGVIIGMTYVLMPFMILTLYGVMRGIDPQYIRASSSLGAHPTETFWRVFFPLSLPGVWAGSLLVFVIAIGFFVTPALLGGGRVPTVATLIESQVRGVLNWGLGSALGVVLLASVLLIYFVFDRVLGVEYMFRRRQ